MPYGGPRGVSVAFEQGTPVVEHQEQQEERRLFHTILWEKSFNLKLSGNEFYSTNALLLIIKIMLCRKLRCQKSLN